MNTDHNLNGTFYKTRKITFHQKGFVFVEQHKPKRKKKKRILKSITDSTIHCSYLALIKITQTQIQIQIQIQRFVIFFFHSSVYSQACTVLFISSHFVLFLSIISFFPLLAVFLFLFIIIFIFAVCSSKEI